MVTRTGLFVLVCLLVSPTSATTDESTVNELLQHGSSHDLADRIDAAYALYLESDFTLGEIRAIQEWVLSESDPFVRFYLVLGLIDNDDDRTVAFVTGLVEQEDPTLRALAVEYSEQHLCCEVEQDLSLAYELEEHWLIRKKIVLTLGKANSSLSLRMLHQALFDPHHGVRLQAISSIDQRRDIRSLEPLVSVYGDADEVAQVAIINALGNYSDDPIVEGILVEAIDSDAVKVRLSAVNAIAFSPETRDIFLGLIQDDEQWIRTRAADRLLDQKESDPIDAILAIVGQNKSHEMFNKATQLNGIDVVASCWRATNLIENQSARAWLETQCREQEKPKALRTITVTTSCSFGRHAGAQKMRVRRLDHDRLEAWKIAPGKRRGGERIQVEPGRYWAIYRAVYDSGTVWVHNDCDLDCWIREADLEAIESAP